MLTASFQSSKLVPRRSSFLQCFILLATRSRFLDYVISSHLLFYRPRS